MNISGNEPRELRSVTLSHYVTETLDAGPIIEQDVLRVTHRHIQRKIIVHKGRTIVFH